MIWARVPGGANTLVGATDKLFETWKEKVETKVTGLGGYCQVSLTATQC